MSKSILTIETVLLYSLHIAFLQLYRYKFTLNYFLKSCEEGNPL